VRVIRDVTWGALIESQIVKKTKGSKELEKKKGEKRRGVGKGEKFPRGFSYRITTRINGHLVDSKTRDNRNSQWEESIEKNEKWSKGPSQL